ncbi:hypothetical protein BZA05DRAFT_245889 [Tricharina praecox]|uniref:uncharacterized protein n=1 Tax=Tricharina praecox TaxID=43433 RepID=UPI00221E3A18|nr:uncharacterized protein BZA05DRAFT_245889 [Tricharina praecox]KAI5854610.1 hypothetical protein BZA05DRAFT_245889 [Tricharina praecox]
MATPGVYDNPWHTSPPSSDDEEPHTSGLPTRFQALEAENRRLRADKRALGRRVAALIERVAAQSRQWDELRMEVEELGGLLEDGLELLSSPQPSASNISPTDPISRPAGSASPELQTTPASPTTTEAMSAITSAMSKSLVTVRAPTPSPPLAHPASGSGSSLVSDHQPSASSTTTALPNSLDGVSYFFKPISSSLFATTTISAGTATETPPASAPLLTASTCHVPPSPTPPAPTPPPASTAAPTWPNTAVTGSLSRGPIVTIPPLTFQPKTNINAGPVTDVLFTGHLMTVWEGGIDQEHLYHNICASERHRGKSMEELRLEDYDAGWRYPETWRWGEFFRF